MIGQPFLFVGFLISYTFSQLKKRTMSQKTSTLQRKFLLALGIQMEVPLVMFLLPFIYGWISILSGYHNQSFVNIAMTIGAFHGFVSTVVMIFVHYPYRETLFNMFIETRMLKQKMVEKEVTQRAGYWLCNSLMKLYLLRKQNLNLHHWFHKFSGWRKEMFLYDKAKDANEILNSKLDYSIPWLMFRCSWKPKCWSILSSTLNQFSFFQVSEDRDSVDYKISSGYRKVAKLFLSDKQIKIIIDGMVE